MGKKALIVAGIIGIVVVGSIIFIFGKEQPQTQTETQNEGGITIVPLPNGWRHIEHPVFGISINIPSAWEITVLENGRGRLEGAFLGAGVNAVINISREENTSNLTSEDLLNKNKSNQASEINRGSIKGVRYISKVGSEHESGFISESYLLINKYFIGDGILNVSCSLSGPNYKTMIPTCEEITGSLQFIN